MSTVTFPEILKSFFTLFFIGFPGVLVCLFYSARENREGSLSMGLCVGLAFQVITLQWSCKFDLRWQGIFLLLAFLAALALMVAGKKRGLDFRKAFPKLPLPLLIILLCHLGILLSTIWFVPLPHGRDPVYHVAISQKYLATLVKPVDFFPYDATPPDYTDGSHWLTAWAGLLNGVSLHRLYQLGMIFFLLVITSLIYNWGRNWRGGKVGIASAIAFIFLANWGSIDIMRWGSLPNLVGVTFFVAIVASLVPLSFNEKKHWLILRSILFSALAYTHHLTTFIFGIFYLTVILYVFAKKYILKSPVDPKILILAKRVTGMIAVSLLICLEYIISYSAHILSRVSSGQASAGQNVAGLPYLNIAEFALYPWDWLVNLGPLFCVLFALGIWLYLKEEKKLEGEGLMMVLLIGGIGAVYFILDWPVRLLCRILFDLNLSVLTPTRFLTDLVYPMSLFAGLGICYLYDKMRWTGMAVVFLGLLNAVYLASPLWKDDMSRETMNGMLWYGKHAPENALLLENPFWVPYVTGREGNRMVLRQEVLTPYTKEKRNIINPKLAALWMEKHKRPVYLWVNVAMEHPKLEMVWREKTDMIYKVHK